MPVAPNVLLQINTVATAKAAAVNNNVLKPADTGKNDASSFTSVYARQAQDKPAVDRDVPVRSARDKGVTDKDKPVAAKDTSANTDKVADGGDKVADSGNSLPDKTVASAGDSDSQGRPDDQSRDQDQAQEQADEAAQLAQMAPLPVASDPLQDPLVQQVVAQQVVAQQAVTPEPVAAIVPAQTESGVPSVPSTAAPIRPSAVAQGVSTALTAGASSVSAAPATDETFDPQADPLEGLHALQFALESSSGTHRSAAAPAETPREHNAQPVVNDDSRSARAENLVNNLASLDAQAKSNGGSTESSDQSFAGVLSEGLKDTKVAAGDTRVDNFAERLAAMSQAAQAAQPARVVNAAPSGSPLTQPLAMHQSGWSEGIVERVMYLSSQNLKSAEIKLEPAELGRLDIRVNMAPDQQTQVTFMSAHVGVRDALENQASRLRESFSQQGLGQVDVNVSDQSQQQAQQQAQEQARQAGSAQRGSLAGNAGAGDGSDEAIVDATAVVSQPVERVIGTSEIDFYA